MSVSKEDHAKYMREVWYPKNREKHGKFVAKTNKRRRQETQEYVNKIKDNPCLDCGKTYPPYVMDFDHVRGSKDKVIPGAIGAGWSRKRIDEEIAKCELVCSNCHRERTHQRKLRVRAAAARLAHIQEVKGPNLAPATT